MLEDIYKKILLLINSVTRLSGICYKYNEDSTEINGEELIKIIDNCEKKFLKVKEEIVIMVRVVEGKEEEVEEVKEVEEMKEIEGIQTENGLLIKE